MRFFREMIDYAKRYPIIKVDGREPNLKITRPGNDHFFSLIEDCQPFVFTPNSDMTEEEKREIYNRMDDKVYSAPFRVFSMEMLGDYISNSLPEEVHQIRIKCLLVFEFEPDDFYTYVYGDRFDNGRWESALVLTSGFTSIINELLKRVNKGQVGTERTRERVKIGTGKTKRTITISNVIHISPKRLRLASNPESGKMIEWTHRFWVRGHWRKIPGRIGKDRQGNPQKDFTWVTEHTKGPEDAPLVDKTRVVSQIGGTSGSTTGTD